MTPRQIRSFLKVVELGSVRRAASALHLAPSSVSAQIAELSAELQTTLFEQRGRQLRLTGNGRDLLPQFMEFARAEKSLLRRARELDGEARGTLQLYAPSSMCIYRVPTLIERLQHSAPGVEIVLCHEPMNYESALLEGEIDAAISVSTSAPPALWTSLRLHAEDVLFFCHPQRALPRSMTLQRLAQQPLITTEPACSYRQNAEQHFRAQGLRLQPRQSFSNVEVIRRCVLADMGIGLLPRCAIDEDLNNGSLRRQPVRGTPYRFSSWLIYPADRVVDARLQALLDAAAAARTGRPRQPGHADSSRCA